MVTLRLRRVGHAPALQLPRIPAAPTDARRIELCDHRGRIVPATAVARGTLVGTSLRGPLLLIDAEATTFVPAGWLAQARDDGSVIIEKLARL